MSAILGIDFETTGLDLKNDRITEVGLVLWDSETKQPTQVAGFLVNTDKEITPEIEKLTGITRKMVNAYGKDEKYSFEIVLEMLSAADYVVAHNGNEFDKVLLENWANRESRPLPDKLWIDTKTDLPEAAYGRSASLKYMACDHGFVYDAHRAVSDVLAMLRILGTYDVDLVIESAKQPTIRVQALVTFDTNKLAKERGYHWKPETKQWIKPIKANFLDKEKTEAKFGIRVLA
jgi:DNA polymerase-3 subunit epsilon